MPTRVLIIDDHEMIRLGLQMLLSKEPGFEVCGEAASGEEGLVLLKEMSPDVAIVDLGLGDMSGLDFIKEAHKLKPQLPILVFSMHDEDIYAERVLRAGARGYVMKDTTASRVIDGLNQIATGEVFVSEDVMNTMLGRMVGAPSAGKDVSSLTDRELEILGHLGQGKPPRRIATDLDISVKTVEAHRESMKRKLNIGSASELTQFAVQWAQRNVIL